jgi:hypothetical protein
MLAIEFNKLLNRRMRLSCANPAQPVLPNEIPPQFIAIGEEELPKLITLNV